MANEKELFLILRKKPFLQILRGEKNEEYRDFTEFFIGKLCELNKAGEIIGIINYDFIRFQLGCSTNAPQMLVEWKDTIIEKDNSVKEDDMLTTENCNFVIELGKIIEKINCESLNI